MFLGIWLVPCKQVPALNPSMLGALVYLDEFTRYVIHDCEEASLGFHHDVFLGKERYINI